MSTPTVAAISPFFIVSDVDRTIRFYGERLGFETTFRRPEESAFFAIVRRDGAQLLVKSRAGLEPLPNCRRHPWMAWDAFVYAPDPDALAADFGRRGTSFSTPLADRDDGLRGFEVSDPDGYVLFFGCPVPELPKRSRRRTAG